MSAPVDCGQLKLINIDVLAFLSLADVKEGLAYDRDHIPTGNSHNALVDLVDYFDATYVTG
jgi:hypothetical protein